MPDSGSAGIASCGDDDADTGVGAPAEDAVADAALDAGFEGFEEIAVQTHEHGLGLGVAEAAVELEDLRAAGGHHEAAVEDSGVGRALGGHAVDDGLRDVADEPLAHVVIEEGGGRVGAHASGVGAGIAIADALVVLGGDQGDNALAIAEAEES